MGIINKNDFIPVFLDRMRKKLEAVLPHEDYEFNMVRQGCNILHKECGRLQDTVGNDINNGKGGE